MAFSPDQLQVLFCRANDDFSAYEIYETRQDAGGRWRPPAKPAFAAAASNADPHISPDGRTAFFISNRPEPGDSGPSATYDIWTVSLAPGRRVGRAASAGPAGQPARRGRMVALGRIERRPVLRQRPARGQRRPRSLRGPLVERRVEAAGEPGPARQLGGGRSGAVGRAGRELSSSSARRAVRTAPAGTIFTGAGARAERGRNPHRWPASTLPGTSSTRASRPTGVGSTSAARGRTAARWASGSILRGTRRASPGLATARATSTASL